MNTSPCTSCGAPILWATTGTGRRVPLDPEPVANGNIAISTTGVGWRARVVKVGEGTHRTHFASCPNAAEHRR